VSFANLSILPISPFLGFFGVEDSKGGSICPPLGRSLALANRRHERSGRGANACLKQHGDSPFCRRRGLDAVSRSWVGSPILLCRLVGRSGDRGRGPVETGRIVVGRPGVAARRRWICRPPRPSTSSWSEMRSTKPCWSSSPTSAVCTWCTNPTPRSQIHRRMHSRRVALPVKRTIRLTP